MSPEKHDMSTIAFAGVSSSATARSNVHQPRFLKRGISAFSSTWLRASERASERRAEPTRGTKAARARVRDATTRTSNERVMLFARR